MYANTLRETRIFAIFHDKVLSPRCDANFARFSCLKFNIQGRIFCFFNPLHIQHASANTENNRSTTHENKKAQTHAHRSAQSQNKHPARLHTGRDAYSKYNKKRLIIHTVSCPFQTGTLCGQDVCRSPSCRRRAPQAPHQCRRSRFRGSIRICRRCGRNPSRRRGNSRY